MIAIENAMIWPGFGAQFHGSLIIDENGIIDEVGDCEKIKLNKLYPDCKKINANSSTVIPAFTECHCHLASIVRDRKFVDLSGAKTYEEVMEIIVNASKTVPEGSWIFGAKFNETKFPDKRIPKRDDLDVIKNPVVIQRICCHLDIINSAAINIIGEKKLESLEGVLKDENGRLNGFLQESSIQCVIPYIDKIPLSDDDFNDVFNEYMSYGVAEIHTVGANCSGLSEHIYQYQDMKQRGKLPVKIVVYLDQETDIGSYLGDDFVSYGGLKIFMDGSLGAQTAALREKYNCCDGTGILNHTDEELLHILEKANSKSQQIMAHCIGDRGIEQIVRVCEKIKMKYPVKLTHVQLCPKDLIERISKLNIITDVQMHMLVSDSPLLEMWLGKERIKDVFPINSMIKAGITVTGSSDAPVEPFNPMTGIWASVVRPSNTSQEENIPLEEALKMYTSNAQKLTGRQDRKGTLEKGKIADIAIFDCNIFEIDPNKLKECHVVQTIINGKIMWERK